MLFIVHCVKTRENGFSQMGFSILEHGHALVDALLISLICQLCNYVSTFFLKKKKMGGRIHSLEETIAAIVEAIEHV